MYEHVILPVDGSAGSDKAAEHALGIAERFDADLHVLHVIDTHRYGEPALSNAELVIDGLEDRGDELIKKFVARAAAAGVDAQSRLCRGYPSSEIVSYAGTVDAGLVVIGTQGLTHDRPGHLGGVADRVVRSCPQPVLLVS
jgi:nucleotide-binding universal stress UspA family protein